MKLKDRRQSDHVVDLRGDKSQGLSGAQFLETPEPKTQSFKHKYDVDAAYERIKKDVNKAQKSMKKGKRIGKK